MHLLVSELCSVEQIHLVLAAQIKFGCKQLRSTKPTTLLGFVREFYVCVVVYWFIFICVSITHLCACLVI